MRFFIEFYVLFCVFLTSDLTRGAGVFPSSEEQVNLLTNVREVFEKFKSVVFEEEIATEKSINENVQRIAKRAHDTLDLLKERAFLKLYSNNNKVCSVDARGVVLTLVQEGKELLDECAKNATVSSRQNKEEINESCAKATERSEELLDNLQKCSRKSGLGVISCYKGIIQTDVLPVKRKLLEYCGDHKNSHETSIDIRTIADDCVDSVLSSYESAINKVITKFVHC